LLLLVLVDHVDVKESPGQRIELSLASFSGDWLTEGGVFTTASRRFISAEPTALIRLLMVEKRMKM
jgi:hypothetical protein